MKLRFGPEVRATFNRVYPPLLTLLTKTAQMSHGRPRPGETTASARYLARALSEFTCRKRNGVRDAKHDPFDEAVWREERALAGDWEASTGYPNGSEMQAFLRSKFPDPERMKESIAEARRIRGEALVRLGNHPTSMGGARRELANAIRHAWLICHPGREKVTYGRQKRRIDGVEVPAGALHAFICGVVSIGAVHVGVDDLHRDVRALDREQHPWHYEKAP